MLIAWTSPYLAHLNIQAGDQTRVEALITAAGKAMERYTGRQLESAEYDQVYKLKTDEVFLSARPVNHVSRVMSDTVDALTLTSSLTAAAYATSGIDLRLRSYNAGAVVSTTLLYSTYTTLTSLATAISAVSGWSASVGAYGAYPSTDLVAGQQGKPANVLQLWLEEGTLYKTERQAGILRLWGTQNNWLARGDMWAKPIEVRVVYTGGYSSIPEDLQKVCSELVSAYLGEYSHIGAQNPQVDVARLSVNSRRTLESYRDRLV